MILPKSLQSPRFLLIIRKFVLPPQNTHFISYIISKFYNQIYKELDQLGGTWAEKDSKEFEEKIAAFKIIDKNIWK